MQATVAVLPGDGIGPEVIGSAVEILRAVALEGGHSLEFREALIGGAAIDAVGHPLPESTLALCRDSDAVLFGAVGGPKWNDPKASVRPEQGLMTLRKGLELFANLRPVRLHHALIHASCIRPEIVDGTDLVIVRELSSGIYYGRRGRGERDGVPMAYDTMAYTQPEIERVMHVAFRLARERRGKVTSVDKANVLEACRLWREVACKVDSEYPDVSLEHLLVDATAMHLIRRPRDFDIIVTSNMFGDILSDEAAMLSGSLGMAPSASLGNGSQGLYEPIHGTAPDIAGDDVANPIGAILSAALLLRHSLNLEDEACAVETAVDQVLSQGCRTADISEEGTVTLGTKEMASRIACAVLGQSGLGSG